MTLDAYKERPKLVFLKQEEWKHIWDRSYEPYEEEVTEFIDALRDANNNPTEYEEDADVQSVMRRIDEVVEDLGLQIVESVDRRTGKEKKLYSFARRVLR